MHVELWYVDLDDIASRLDAMVVVSSSDRAAAQRFGDDVLRRRFLARRAATRHVLGRSLAQAPAELQMSRRCPRCGETDHGRPLVKGLAGDFSVSSRGRRALIAVGEQRVGVDIEVDQTAGTSPPVVPGAVLTAAERAWLDALPLAEQGRCFLQMWTLKEAVLKADGGGLSVDPTLVDTSSVLTAGTGQIALAGRQWTVKVLTPPGATSPDVVMAVAGATEISTSWRYLRWPD